jgi:hypothetical protein
MAPEVVSFFESPVGTAFLHRLVIAAHFAITMLGSNGIRLVCMFFELTGLDKFVASSYGAQHAVSGGMEQAIIEFDEQEKESLAMSMPSKDITVCQDETFHPEICLVAIEPVSNFILLEKYADSRKSAEWTEAMEEATKELPVKIVQSASDEAKGIAHHVKGHLGAHHAPDLFHVQNEIVKGTSAVLSSKRKKAEKALKQANDKLEQSIENKEFYQKVKNGPGRPPNFDKRIEAAEKIRDEAQKDLDASASHQERMKEVVHKIGAAYHPVDIETGKMKEADEVAEELRQCFVEAEEVASEARLPERSLKRIKKAERVVVDMVATVQFYHLSVRAKVEALSLPPGAQSAVPGTLIPGLYIQRISKQAKTAADRSSLRQKSCEILSLLEGENNPFIDLSTDEQELTKKTAEECANLFQRSSSCVEGRNGQLSLRHHSLHRISNRKLAALTAVHNYFIKRPDGTTAAERFFGNKPKDMFEYLLEKVELPGRPARSRS